MKISTKKMFQEFVNYIDFPTVAYIHKTGRIIAVNYHAEAIIGKGHKYLKDFIDNQTKNCLSRFVADQVKQVFNNVEVHRGSGTIEVDVEVNVIPCENENIIICFFEESYKMMYEKYLSLLVPRLFSKDINLKFTYCNKYFLLDSHQDKKRDFVNEDFLDDSEESRYILEAEREILNSNNAEYNAINTIRVRGYKEYFMKVNRMPLLDENGKTIGLLGVYNIILNREEYQGLFNATLRENQILNRIISQHGQYVVSWKMDEGWPIEYISSNFVDFGYRLMDAYNGKLVWGNIVHSEDYVRIQEELRKVIEERSHDMPELVYRLRKANGRYVWVKDSTYSLGSNGETYLREGLFRVLPEESYKELEKNMREVRAMKVTTKSFGKLQTGEEVTAYTLINKNGMEVTVLDYGAIVKDIIVADKNGEKKDIALGYDNLEGYVEGDSALGSFIGRHANRIKDAQFSINGTTYELQKNDNGNNLHGGDPGYNKVMYEAEILKDEDAISVELSRLSKDMEQGFPGNLDITVTYTLTEEDEFVIEYLAVSDKDTVVNFTNHSYFNLAGQDSGTILEQQVAVFADQFTPTDDELIPTGELRDVAGTPMDFNAMKKIGQDINADYEPLKQAKGYDHNFVLRHEELGEVELVAQLWDEKSGRLMEVFTDQPGIQLYSGCSLNDSNGKGGVNYGQYAGVCFETQNFPNAVNTPNFPDAILKAGQEYNSVTIYKFSTK